MHDAEVDELAAAVLDSSPIDWPSIERRLTTPEARAVGAELRALSSLTQTAGIAATPQAAGSTPAIWLEVVRCVAIAETLVGLGGFVTFLISAPSPDRRLLLMSAVLAFAGAATFLDRHARDRRGRLLACVYWSIAAAFSASGIALLAALPWGISAAGVLLSVRPDAFLPAFMWQFAREFPAVNRFSVVDRVFALATFASLVISSALFLANLASLLYGAPPGWFAALLRFPGTGTWFWNIVFGAAIPALGVILWRARSAGIEENARVRLFLYAIAAALAPVATMVIAEGVSPGFAAVIDTPRGQFWGGLIIYPPLLALPVLTAYAIGAGDVLYIRVSVQQGLRYLLTKWLMGAAVGAAGLSALIYVYRHRDLSVVALLAAPAARAILALNIAGVILLACRARVLRALDRWARPGDQEASAMFASLGERMKNSRTPLEIAEALADGAETMLRTSTEVLLLKNEVLWPVRPETPRPPADSLIPVLVSGTDGACFVEDGHPQSYYGLLSEEDRTWIDRQRIALVVPVLSGRHHGGPRALVCVRHRRSALPFSSSDIRFLRATAASAALAYDALHADVSHAGAPFSEDGQELAFECVKCGVVAAWSRRTDSCACGGCWRQASLPVDLLGRFTVDRFIGAGGMGAVYLGTDRILGRRIALKTLTRLSGPAAERLIVEARTMAALSHSQIGVLYGTEVWRSTPVLILEYLPAGTLADALRNGPLAIDRVIPLVLQLSAALEHLHRSGVYHGDIKPSNIAFTETGVPKY
nr:protein kinase [Acidobacteriota bacterium]